MNLAPMHAALRRAELVRRTGEVSLVRGLTIESSGPDASIGEMCEIIDKSEHVLGRAEVVGLRNGRVQLLPYGSVRGLSQGCQVAGLDAPLRIPLGRQLLGRVINAFGEPLDGRPLERIESWDSTESRGTNALQRPPIDTVVETGVKVIDCFATLGRGQRMGIFAGSGVGKSTLMGMLSRNLKADINVVALLGERGREVREFIDKSLAGAMERSVVVVAVADDPPLARVKAATTATRIAEDFRDQGAHVALIVDSITRYAMALREVGLALGEPPTARGYTPTVFTALPELIERAGAAGARGGAITGLYTVLVEGDDMNEPVADHMRAVLDGGLVLSRELANQGHFPAVDVLRSNSRLFLSLSGAQEQAAAREALAMFQTYEKFRDMIEVGAYKQGGNAEIDRALAALPALRAFLRQGVDEVVARPQAAARLRELMAQFRH